MGASLPVMNSEKEHSYFVKQASVFSSLNKTEHSIRAHCIGSGTILFAKLIYSFNICGFSSCKTSYIATLNLIYLILYKRDISSHAYVFYAVADALLCITCGLLAFSDAVLPFKTGSVDSLWLQYTDLDKEGDFRTENGEPMGEYRPIYNFDNYGGKEHCVETVKLWNWMWNDNVCSNPTFFGCQSGDYSLSFVLFCSVFSFET